MPYKLKLKADAVESTVFLSLGELATACNRKKITLKKLIERGILPESNYRTPKTLIKRGDKQGEYMDGYRLYSQEFLVPKLITFFKGVTQGKKITNEQRVELMDIFQSELIYFQNKN